MGTDPILPCDVERFVLANDTSVMLERPRIVQTADGRTARGYVVGDDGRTTPVAKAIVMKDVVAHIAMGWRNSDSTLHDMRDRRPMSLG